jgi:conjugative transposon TraN protein
MKKIFSIIFLFGILATTYSQSTAYQIEPIKSKILQEALPKIYITNDINILFRSPETVQFVDLSSEKLIGDLPADNIVRLKLAKYKSPDKITDSLQIFDKEEIKYFDGQEVGIISVVGQSFVAQYQIVYTSNNLAYGAREQDKVITNVQISGADMQQLEYPTITLSDFEMKHYSQKIMKYGEKKKLRRSEGFKMGIDINNIYALDNYIFLDISFKNSTNLVYEIGDVEFSIDDKRIYKATNNQSIVLKPVFKLYEHSKFRKQFRNIYVLQKFTFPNNKVLNVRIHENGISGRTLSTIIKYSDLLEADTF